MECVSLHTGSYFCETQLTSAGCVKIKKKIKKNLPQNYVPRSHMLAKQLKYLMLQRVYFILMLAKPSLRMHFTRTVYKC